MWTSAHPGPRSDAPWAAAHHRDQRRHRQGRAHRCYDPSRRRRLAVRAGRQHPRVGRALCDPNTRRRRDRHHQSRHAQASPEIMPRCRGESGSIRRSSIFRTVPVFEAPEGPMPGSTARFSLARRPGCRIGYRSRSSKCFRPAAGPSSVHSAVSALLWPHMANTDRAGRLTHCHPHADLSTMDDRTSRTILPSARWANRFAQFFACLLLISIPLHRFGGLSTPVALNVFAVALAGPSWPCCSASTR